MDRHLALEILRDVFGYLGNDTGMVTFEEAGLEFGYMKDDYFSEERMQIIPALCILLVAGLDNNMYMSRVTNEQIEAAGMSDIEVADLLIDIAKCSLYFCFKGARLTTNLIDLDRMVVNGKFHFIVRVNILRALTSVKNRVWPSMPDGLLTTNQKGGC